MKWYFSSIGAVIALTLSSVAAALPREGERAPVARLEDADGAVLDTRALLGKPALVIYETKESAHENATLKAQLGELARDVRYRAAVRLAAIADLTAYRGWPLEGIARRAIRRMSQALGTPVYCDWTGAFRTAYRLEPGRSNVILLAADGRILFAAAGPLREQDRAHLLALVQRDMG